ncbi:MAG: serine hydrolase domain-containing protein [Polyangiaceae bacterium]
MYVKRFFLAGFLFLGCSSSSTNSSNATTSDAGAADAGDPTTVACDALVEVIAPAVDTARVNAKSSDAIVGVTTNTCPMSFYASGPSNIGADDRVRIASITKTYVSAVILHFVEAGAVKLDDTIAQFALGIPNDTSITVRMLLDHTSGLFDYTQDPGFLTHLDWTPEQRIAISASHPAEFAPGTSWDYSNTNFIALGLIAQKLGNAPIGKLIHDDVLTPNGFSATYFDGEDTVEGTIAPSFSASGKTLTTGRFGAWADGAIATTPAELTRWMRRYASGDETPTLKGDLLNGVDEGPGAGETYGLALEILDASTTGNGTAYGHGGDIPGFHSLAFYFPDRGWTISAIVNKDGSDPNVIMLAVVNALRAANL